MSFTPAWYSGVYYYSPHSPHCLILTMASVKQITANTNHRCFMARNLPTCRMSPYTLWPNLPIPATPWRAGLQQEICNVRQEIGQEMNAQYQDMRSLVAESQESVQASVQSLRPPYTKSKQLVYHWSTTCNV